MNTPKQPYGYMPPKLGGEGMGKPNGKELCWLVDKWTGAFLVSVSQRLEFINHLYYTRPIDVGEGQG